MEKGFPVDTGYDHKGAVNNRFPVYWAIFGMVTPKQTNDQIKNHVTLMQPVLDQSESSLLQYLNIWINFAPIEKPPSEGEQWQLEEKILQAKYGPAQFSRTNLAESRQ